MRFSLCINAPQRLFALLATLLCCAGCTQDLDTWYGERTGILGEKSVNGTAILGDMFVEAGHRVISWRRLSPKLRERADVVVWFPSDFQAPSPEAREWLDEWLWEENGRILIYVGRDFDAAPGYWRRMQENAPSEQVAEIKSRLRAADAAYRAQRITWPPGAEDCDWFTIDGRYQHRDVRTLQGEPQWIEGINPAALEIEIHDRISTPVDFYEYGDLATALDPARLREDLDAPLESEEEEEDEEDGVVDGSVEAAVDYDEEDYYEDELDEEYEDEQIVEDEMDAKPTIHVDVLLSSEGDELVTRQWYGDSQLIVVSNGSFLLNLPLVNREHRKLAGRLINEVPDDSYVMFLETPATPEILEEEPDAAAQTGWSLFGIWPFSAIMLHLAILGMIFCLWRFPIFGIPREADAADPSDFGQHVAALGALLGKTGNRTYAEERIAQYQHSLKHQPSGPPVPPLQVASAEPPTAAPES